MKNDTTNMDVARILTNDKLVIEQLCEIVENIDDRIAELLSFSIEFSGLLLMSPNAPLRDISNQSFRDYSELLIIIQNAIRRNSK